MDVISNFSTLREILLFILSFVIGLILGRLSMAIQYALGHPTQKKTVQDTQKNT